MSVEEVDSHIDELSETLRLLKARRNKLAAIAVLPTDLLLEIFMHLPSRLMPMNALQRKYMPPTQADRLHVSHVCQEWRALCLATAAFWNEPSFEVHPALIREMLRRLAASSFSVTFARRFGGDVQQHEEALLAVEEALKKTEQLRAITLSGDRPFFEHISPICSPHVFPMLEEVNLCRWGHVDAGAVYSTEDLFAGAPRLRTLKLNRISLRATSPLLLNLTELVLEDSVNRRGDLPIDDVPPARASVSETYTMLQQARNLQHLTLIYVLPLVEEGVSYGLHMYPSLEHLVSLTLIDETPFALHFIEHIDAPVLQTRSFQFLVDPPQHDALDLLAHADHTPAAHDVPAITGVLNAHLGTGQPLPPLTRAAVFVPDMVLNGSADASSAPVLDLSISCPGERGHEQHLDVCGALLGLRAFRALAHLTLVPECGWGMFFTPGWTAHAGWAALFCAHPALRTLQLGCSAPYERLPGPYTHKAEYLADLAPIYRALIPQPEQEGAAPETPCPKLEVLVLDHAFRTEDTLAMQEMFLARRDAGHPFKTLRVKGKIDGWDVSVGQTIAEAAKEYGLEVIIDDQTSEPGMF